MFLKKYLNEDSAELAINVSAKARAIALKGFATNMFDLCESEIWVYSFIYNIYQNRHIYILKYIGIARTRYFQFISEISRRFFSFFSL